MNPDQFEGNDALKLLPDQPISRIGVIPDPDPLPCTKCRQQVDYPN